MSLSKSQGFVSINVYRHAEKKWENVVLNKKNLLTNNGRDYYHAQVLTNTGGGGVGSNFVAVTNTASFTPVVGDTTLSGELATNGFTRALATTGTGSITHTTGTNSTTISHTYTATGTQTAIQGSALFNASSAGTMTHEAAFTSTDLVTNDLLAVTWTINVG